MKIYQTQNSITKKWIKINETGKILEVSSKKFENIKIITSKISKMIKEDIQVNIDMDITEKTALEKAKSIFKKKKIKLDKNEQARIFINGKTVSDLVILEKIKDEIIAKKCNNDEWKKYFYEILCPSS